MASSRPPVKTLFFVGLVLTVGIALASSHLADAPQTQDGPYIGATNGPAVSVESAGQINMDPAVFAPEPTRLEVVSDVGNATFVSQGRTNASVPNLLGTWTNTTDLDVEQELYADPEDKRPINVSGATDTLNWTSMAVDDGQADFVYSATSGTTNVAVRGVAANQRIAAVDQRGIILDTSVSDGSGTVAFRDLPNSKHVVTLQTSDGPPELSNPQPQSTQSSTPTQLSIDVDDPDFPNDNVTVEFTMDGSVVGSDTVDDSGAASVSVSPSRGQHTVEANATDEYNQSAIASWTFGAPETLTLKNETRPSETVTVPTNVTFYTRDGDPIFSRNTSDGTIDMSGIDGEGSYIVTASPSHTYTDRTVFIQDIAEQTSIYLLNATAYSTTEARFVLNDPTAQFSRESLLFVSRDINSSFQTIYTDEFGAEGVTAELQEGQRFRLTVRNRQGNEQTIGPYRADVAETVEVIPGSPGVPLGEFEAGWNATAELRNTTLEYRYADPEEVTDRVTVWIHEKNNESNRLQPNESHFDLGNVSSIATLTGNESEQTWVVNFVVDRDGETFTKRVEVSNQADIVPALSREWRLITGIGLLIVSAAAFSLLNVGVGAVVVSLEGGILWWTGWLAGATTGAAVLMALFISILFHSYRNSGP